MAAIWVALGVGTAPVREELIAWRAWIILSSVVGVKLGRLCGRKWMASLMMTARDSFVRTRWQR